MTTQPTSSRAAERRQLADGLSANIDAIVADMALRTLKSGGQLDPDVEVSIAEIASTSTSAFARWLGGEGLNVARTAGLEAAAVFGQLAIRRAAPLYEITKRCLRWHDSVESALRRQAALVQCSEATLLGSLRMLRKSTDVTMIRMCESYELARQEMHEELDRRQEELSFLATHDPLTGLPNRTLLLDRVAQQLARSQRSSERVALIFIDLDNFKLINDTFGHKVGDEVLRAVAARLSGVVRAADTLGRLGGDEFVVVAEGSSIGSGVEAIGDRLADVFRAPFKIEAVSETPIIVTASIGIAIGDRHTPEELLSNADTAMYQAKWTGKGRYVTFSTEIQHSVQSRLKLEMELRIAVEEGQFFLVYQPAFDLSEMRVAAVEALLRWDHPERGILPPGEFLPILEESGLILTVGDWVMNEACRQGSAWRAAGHSIGVAVNISSREIGSDQLIDRVRDALSASGLAPHTLILEVAETALVHDAQALVNRLRAIKTLGVRTVIDNFGTAYSSLAFLQQFPVDALKIDRSFLSRMSGDSDGQELMRSMIQLGNALSIETLAEGVENIDQLDLLKSEKCGPVSGYLLARPLVAEGVESFLREWRPEIARAVTFESLSASDID